MAVTRAQVYVGMYVDQVMLRALKHAEPASLSCFFLTSSGSHSRSSSIFVTLVEKSLKTYLAALGKTCSKALMFACQTGDAFSNIGCTIILYVEAFTCGV